jgi:hypothetical protein
MGATYESLDAAFAVDYRYRDFEYPKKIAAQRESAVVQSLKLTREFRQPTEEKGTNLLTLAVEPGTMK